MRHTLLGMIPLSVLLALGACGGATQTRLYEIGPTITERSYQRVHMRRAGVDDGLQPGVVETFEAEFARELTERGFEVVDTAEGSLEVVYRSVSYNAGSTAGRLASAVAGFVSPVGTLGQEAGSGEVAVKFDYIAPDGTRVADVVIQQQISGATAHTELTVRAIAGTAAKFTAARFKPGADVASAEEIDDAWSGGLPLFRALEGRWRYAAVGRGTGVEASGTVRYELHHGGLLVLVSSTVDGRDAAPEEAVTAMLQRPSGRVLRWWLDPVAGVWRESLLRLASRPDGFTYRTEIEGVRFEGVVRASTRDPLATIELTRTEPDGSRNTVEVRMERID